MPTTRGRRWVPPSTRGTPQRRSKRPKVEPRRGDPQVAPERQLDPAGQAPAVDRGDRRLGRGEPGRPHRPVRVVDVEVHRLQVGAGAEGLAAGAGEDEDAGALVGLEVLQALAERLGGGGVDRVAALGPVDRQHRGRADPLVAKLLAHRGILAESMGAGGLVAEVPPGLADNARSRVRPGTRGDRGQVLDDRTAKLGTTRLGRASGPRRSHRERKTRPGVALGCLPRA